MAPRVLITTSCVAKIAKDQNHRRLLGMDGNGFSEDAEPAEEYRKTLTALGQRGHVAHDVHHRPVRLARLPLADEPGVLREAAGVEDQRHPNLPAEPGDALRDLKFQVGDFKSSPGGAATSA